MLLYCKITTQYKTLQFHNLKIFLQQKRFNWAQVTWRLLACKSRYSGRRTTRTPHKCQRKVVQLLHFVRRICSQLQLCGCIGLHKFLWLGSNGPAAMHRRNRGGQRLLMFSGDIAVSPLNLCNHCQPHSGKVLSARSYRTA